MDFKQLSRIVDAVKPKRVSKAKKTLSDRQYQDIVESWLNDNQIPWEYVDAERGQVVNGVLCNYLKFPDWENGFTKDVADNVAELLESAPVEVKGPKNWGMPHSAIHWEGSWWVIWNVVDESDFEAEKEYGHNMLEDEDWIW